MYIANILNSQKLFQQTGGWMLMPGAERNGKAFAVMLQRATQALYHLDQCEILHRQAIAQFSSHLQQEPQVPVSLRVWSPIVSGLIAELSGALATIRVLQNDAWQLIAAMSGARNFPQSITDAYKVFERDSRNENNLPRWLEAIDTQTKDIIVNYWETSGLRLANQRDVDQHFDVLARGAILFQNNMQRLRLTILLPDNPEEKALSRFTYTEEVDAMEVVVTGFARIHSLIEQIAENNGAKPQSIGQSFEFRPAIVHQAGISTLTAILIYDYAGKSSIVLGQNEEMHVTSKFTNL